ncbi:hypothetical protein M2161_007647 [Streptomyces sp. SAI-133]|nr:hypothetical protein [Streptomyces sp. SAI-133]MDH6588541.1 hypothetical protein [Streptomyces sp. SAI-133]
MDVPRRGAGNCANGHRRPAVASCPQPHGERADLAVAVYDHEEG